MSKEYLGQELNIFKNAINWKTYFSKKTQIHIQGNVLEVGAGIGGTTNYLLNDKCNNWTCLEPDEKFIQIIQDKIKNHQLPNICKVQKGVIQDLNPNRNTFNTILYIDVLEHICSDKDELHKAAQLLEDQGKLIILAPAHNFLYSQFDKMIGHYRRYNRKSVTNILPDNLKIEKIYYLDCIGTIFSLTNKIFLKTHSPSVTQIYFWDKIFVKISIIVDWIINYTLGKSILIILNKQVPS